MSKSTIIIIFVIYLASIVVIGFFGMSIKIFDPEKYVQDLQINIEAANKDMYDFEVATDDDGNPQPKDVQTGYNAYELYVYLHDNHFIDGQGRRYSPLSIIPMLTYSSGDIAKLEDVKIRFSINDNIKDVVGNGYVTLSDLGQLVCYQSDTILDFTVIVNLEGNSKPQVGAIIHVSVFDVDFS